MTQLGSDGVMLAPGGGRHILGGGVDARVLTTGAQGASTSSFISVVPPGYDVGAHVHGRGEEVFFVLEGRLDVLAFTPVDRTVPDWHDWRSADGRTYLRGGPGSFLWVPPHTPHAFANRGDEPVTMFFQSSVPGGHENYFEDLRDLLMAAGGPPDPHAVAELRARYDIEQLTELHNGGTA
jgi:mannose-6-phosphate isomerase-like protein (cupin superfamily)